MDRRRWSGFLALCSLVALGVAPAASSASLHATAPVWKTLKPPSAPAWYTPELRRQVRAAGAKGVPIPPEAEIPVSSLAFLGIRPGQLIILTNDASGTTSLCTSNFIFTDTAGNYFVGTAGHCGVVGDSVDMLYLPGGLVHIGSVVRSTGDAGIGNDFALISIDPSLYGDVSPSMAFWGGPTGANTQNSIQVVEHIGWGLVIGTGGTPRVGVGTEFGPNSWWFVGAITPGDSGSGARTASGLAAGNITHIAIDLNHIGDAAGTSISKIMQILGSGYQLATCASALPWPLPGCP
jgi:hypothetical protein